MEPQLSSVEQQILQDDGVPELGDGVPPLRRVEPRDVEVRQVVRPDVALPRHVADAHVRLGLQHDGGDLHKDGGARPAVGVVLRQHIHIAAVVRLPGCERDRGDALEGRALDARL